MAEYRFWTIGETQFLLDNYRTMTNKAISLHLGRTPGSVDRRLKRLNLRRRYESFSGGFRLYSLNEKVFSHIDTQDKAYCLGFILGDGSVSKDAYYVNVTLKEDDVEILHYFKYVLQTSTRVYCYLEKEIVTLKINSKRLVSDLIGHGVIPNKVRSINIPIIRSDLYVDFIRGLFDADGCIYVNKKKSNDPRVTLAGDIVTCSWFKGFVEDSLGVHVSFYGGSPSNCKYSTISGRNNCARFAKWLYKDANFFLSRKYNKFVEAGLL